MKDSMINPKLVFEETKAIKLFLWLFYIFYVSFDVFYYKLYPLVMKTKVSNSHEGGLGLWVIVLVLGIVPVANYYIKRKNPYIVKYICFFGYLFIDTLDNLMIYWGTSKPFASENIVEVLFVFFAPIFVNKKYFWTVMSGLIGKYIFLGVVLLDSRVILAIIINLILGVISYIVLTRFFSYIRSLSAMHEELRQKEKMAVIGQMAAAIGHEIKNPLSSLKGFTQLQHERFPNTNEFYPIMIQEIDRINSILNDLRYLGKPRAIYHEKTDIKEIITYTLSIIQPQAKRQDIIIETIFEEFLPPIECDINQLKQVFINLIKNAIEAMSNGGRIYIAVKVLKEKEMYISIIDEGCGIPEENVGIIGEPFFTTKQEGTGLGFMITQQIIKDHNGKIMIESKQGQGTKVEVILPLSQK